jgi:hypothetical protein
LAFGTPVREDRQEQISATGSRVVADRFSGIRSRHGLCGANARTHTASRMEWRRALAVDLLQGTAAVAGAPDATGDLLKKKQEGKRIERPQRREVF